MSRRIPLRRLCGPLVVLCALALAGCDPVAGLIGAYTGPAPEQVDLVNEVVIVRVVYRDPGTGIQRFFADRERYVAAGDPHNINRVVEVTGKDIQPQLSQFGLKIGDRLRISTRYLYQGEMNSIDKYIPNWHHDKYFEYPIGVHTLVSFERVSP